MTASQLISDARDRLAGTPRERLGEWATSRKILGIGRAPRIVPVAESVDEAAAALAEAQRS